MWYMTPLGQKKQKKEDIYIDNNITQNDIWKKSAQRKNPYIYRKIYIDIKIIAIFGAKNNKKEYIYSYI